MSLEATVNMIGAIWTVEKYQVIREANKEAFPAALRHLERELKSAAPVATGKLQDSINAVHFPDNQGGKVVNEMWQGIPIDAGSAAGFRPVEPIREWVEVKLGITGDEAKRVAHAIAYDHSLLDRDPAKFWWATFDRMVPVLNSQYLDRVGSSIVKKMEKSSKKTTKRVSR
ncbi:MAG: hypothetical protein WC314_19880 [Vulcanimicrobiota bacterium]